MAVLLLVIKTLLFYVFNAIDFLNIKTPWIVELFQNQPFLDILCKMSILTSV